MKKIIALMVLSLWFATALSALERIISLSPSITETLFAVGAGKQVVGVTRFCHFPPEAMKKNKIGGFLDTDMETILALKPDMVFLIDTDINNLKHLKQLGIPCTVVTQTTISGIERTVKKLGFLTGHVAEAATLAEKIKREKAGVQKSGARLKVLLVAGRDPGVLKNIFVAGNTGFYDEIITAAGCRNAFRASFPVAYPSVSLEGVLSMDPDMIIELVDDLRAPSMKGADLSQDWQKIPYLKAVKNGKVFILVRDYATVPGPRIFGLISDIRKLATGK